MKNFTNNTEQIMNIAVLVSGGVDSSVALKLLKDQGHKVTAFYLKIWLEDELSFLGSCPWQEDLEYVQKVSEQLDIPLKIVPLQKEYWDRVVSYTLEQIKRGKTPNPDIMCNQHVKFGAFFDVIGDSFDKVATGHYAKLVSTDTGVGLYQSPDAIKDQTYFLSQVSQEQLSRMLFPIGHLTKAEVREYARAHNLPTKDRKDSQGICFLGKISFPDFVRYHLGEKEGKLIEYETGNICGEHKGYWFYTIGQRQGIGLAGGPWYVVAKDVKENIVYISRNYYAQDKKRDTLYIKDCNWITKKPSDGVYHIKLRHGSTMHTGHLMWIDDGKARLALTTQDQGIAAGQFAVVYDKDECLGSGVIAQ